MVPGITRAISLSMNMRICCCSRLSCGGGWAGGGLVADPWGGIMSEGSTGAEGEKVGAGLGWIGFLHLLRRR